MIDSPQKCKEIFNYVCCLSKGEFGRVKASVITEQNSLPYMAFFSCKISERKVILFNVGIEKIPILDKYGKSLISFEFLHYLRFLDILKDNTNLLSSAAKYFNQYAGDPARGDFFQEIQEEKTRYQGGDTLFERHVTPLGDSIVLNLSEQVFPSKFKAIFLTKLETNSMIFDAKSSRWMPSDLKLQQERRIFLSYSKKVNEELLKQYADFSSAAKLVELLEKIPNFKLKLTSQEKDVIGQGGNVLAIGRSGTGKTTCAILRIFSMEILFKIRITLYKNKLEGLLKDTRFQADDLDKTVGLHCVFVTASPVLTTEVQRYYEKLTKHVKEELKRKQQKDKLRREQEKAQKEKEEAEKNQEEEEICEKEEKIEGIEDFSIVNEVENQIKEIKLEEEPINEEKDLGLDDEELQKKMLKYTSMNEMKEEDFPAFLTLRNLLIMVDGALIKPFFTRNKDNQIIGGDSSANWHNESKGVLMIDDYHRKMGEAKPNNEEIDFNEEDEDEASDLDYENEEELEYAYQRELFLQEAHRNKEKKRTFVSDLKKKLSFEVDYEYFETYFWPKVLKKYQHLPSITATAVWTEIYSYIKGSASSHMHPAGYLPEKVYLDLLTERKSMMDLDTKKLIFEIYCMYERWKQESSGYDLLDVVNYILMQMRYGRYQGTPVHYMMVDEVQDLPHAMLLLLSQMTEQGLFFSGDTAQNIAKGVGFRFCDLSHVFDKNNFPNHEITKPVVRHLTVNFRSHSRILDLANSLVSILELCFPKTIDRLQKEKSNLDGPKPILLEHNDTELLFLVLLGEADYKSQKEGSLLSRPQVEFGCNQVILVRDQKSKEKVPKILQHALCLTIYEAKGLEFDDVVLFNFFSDSTMETNKWCLLNHLLVIDKLMEKDDYLKTITIHEIEKKKLEELEDKEGEEKDDFDKLYGAKEVNGKILTKNVGLNKSFYTVDINQYSIVCTELKQLYTAITRPRNKLIIFDDNLEKREAMSQFWERLNLIEIVDKGILDKIEIIDTNNLKGQKEYNVFRSILKKTSNEEWRNQGLKMLKHKYYEQAIKCFEKAGDQILLKRAQAFYNADEATKKIAKVEAERVYIADKMQQYSEIKKSQRRTAKKQLNLEEDKAILDLKAAADIFLAIELPKQAAQCLFSAKEYRKACEIYLSLQMWTQAGEAYFILEDYKTAAECFDRVQDYIRVMECYEAMEEWEKLIEVVYKYKGLMKPQDKESYIRKFVPLALEKLVSEICFHNEFMEQDKENLVIKENPDVDSDEEESDSDEEEEKQKDNEIKIEENKEIKENQLSIETSAVKIEENKADSSKIQEISLDIESSKLEEIALNPNNQKDQTASLIDNISLSVANKNQPNISFEEMNISDIHSQLEKNEHLSNIDLNDEFLKHESASIIESLSQIRKENSKVQSDYSAIEYSAYMGNQNMAIVKTKTDIYAQDQTMQKIIRYISFFSDEFREQLAKIRSKTSLLIEKKPLDNEYDEIVDLIVDLDSIDLEFLHLMLDSLETFKIYKLCIFICNRYKLSNRIGRYLVSIANKYSSFAQESLQIPMLPTHFLNSFYRKTMMEKAFFGNIALHNVLENINPNYLKLKRMNEISDNSNSLGMDAFQGLIQLGFWKKCVFLTDYSTALSITSSFGDFATYKLIFLSFNDKYAQNQTFMECLQSACEWKKLSFSILPFAFPTNELESELCLIALDHSEWALNECFPFRVSRNWSVNPNKPISSLLDAFPNYFAYSGKFWRFALEKFSLKDLFEEYLLESLKSILKIFNNEPMESEFLELRVYDQVIFFINVLVFGFFVQDLRKILLDLPNSTLFLIVTVYEKLLEFERNIDTLNRFSDIILRAILSAFRIRTIKDSDIFKIYGLSKAFMHRSSSIFFDVIKDKEVFPIDIDEEMFLVDMGSCLQIINTKLFLCLKDLFMRKLQRIDSSQTPVFIEICSLGWINSRFSVILKRNDEEKQRTNFKPEDILFYPESMNHNLFTFLEESYLNLKNKTFWPNLCLNKEETKGISLWIIDQVLKELGTEFNDEISDSHWKIAIGFEILRVFGKQTVIYEILRRKRADKKTANYFKLIEAYWYKRYNCLEEYIECLFEYLSQTFNLKSSPFEEKATRLTEAAISIIFGYNLMKNPKKMSSVFIPSAFMKYLPENINEMNPLTQERADDLIYETFFWIKKLCMQTDDLSYSNAFHMMMVLMTLIINLKGAIKDEVYKEISKAVEILHQDTMEHSISELTSLKNSCKTLKDLTIAADKMVEKKALFEGYPLETIEIQNSKDGIFEKNAENCEREWMNFQIKRAERITSKRIILKYYRNKPKKQKKIKNPENSIILLRFLSCSFDEKLYKNLVDFFKSYSFISEQISPIENLTHDVIKTFYKHPLENSLDFHYLNKQSIYILAVYQELKNSILDYMQSKNQKVLFEEFVKMKKKLEALKESFEVWKSANNRTEKNFELDTKKNRKILSLKLVKKGMLSRATQIAQRRAGLRKQKALQQKAGMVKIMEKKNK